MFNTYFENGVLIKPNVIAKGEEATVVYNGLLYKSGADAVYMHTGFGNNWQDTRDIPMHRIQDGFEAKIPITSTGNLNMVFKDSANNWDNNCSANYSFQIQER